MARGAAQQESLLNQQAGAASGQASSLYNTIGQTSQQLMTPGSRINDQAVRQATVPVAGQMASAQTALSNRSVTGRNTAGYISGEDQLARTGAQQMGQAADTTLTNNFNTGLKAESSLYAPTIGAASSLYDTATKAMSQRKDPFSLGVGWSAANGLSVGGSG